MFYIDKVLFTNPNLLSNASSVTTESTSSRPFTTEGNVEKVPEEIAEGTGSLPDVLLADSSVNDNETESVTNASQVNTIK